MKQQVVGVVFSHLNEHRLSDLTANRCMGAIPVGGRYRLIDFVLSSFANSGIENVGVITEANYQSLLDHLGTGREWDLSRKKGGLVILPPFRQTADPAGTYRGRIDALYGVMGYLKSSGAKYAVLADCDMLINARLGDMLACHMESGADITVMYRKASPSTTNPEDNVLLQTGQNGEVTDILIDPPTTGVQNVYINIMVISKSLLEYLVGDCYSRNHFSFERDFLQANLGRYKIYAYEYTGYMSRCDSLQGYYAANMALLDSQARSLLFPRGSPIYTKVRDEAPVRYGLNSKVSNSMIADGCLIEGEVHGSILFRGVTVGKGAVVKNSIIMQGTSIGENTSLDCVITDKDVTIRDGRTIMGFHTYPVYISKGSAV